MRRALAVDPDLHHAGVALVEDSGIDGQRPKVMWAGVALAPRKLKSYAAASALLWPEPPMLAYHLLVVEGQRIYPHSQVRPEDLMHLAFAAGLALAHYRGLLDRVAVPLPQEWKGTVPKGIAHARILSRCILTPEVAEIVAGPHASHVTDAIGLALYGLGLPGATASAAGPLPTR